MILPWRFLWTYFIALMMKKVALGLAFAQYRPHPELALPEVYEKWLILFQNLTVSHR